MPGPFHCPDDLPPEWRFRYEERAAIMEYDGLQSRANAEALAFADTLRQIEMAAQAR